MSFFSVAKDVLNVGKDVAGLAGGAVEAYGNYAAGEAQRGAAGDVNQLAAQIYRDSRRDQKPYRRLGQAALNQLQGVYIDGTQDYKQSPGYQFRFDEGVKAVNRGGASRGMQLSGRGQKELTRFGQGIAAADYNDNFNRLSSAAGTGQTATNATQSAGSQYGQLASGALYNAGNARASSYAGAGSGINSGINNYLAYDYLR